MCLHAKSLQTCPTLCHPMDRSPRGSSIMGFSRQEYWSGLPCPPPGDLPNPGMESPSLTFPALTGRFFTSSATWQAQKPTSEVIQSCLPLCEPMDYSLPSSSVHGIFQARVLEWGAIAFSSPVQFFGTPWTIAYQAPLSMEFSRQEY